MAGNLVQHVLQKREAGVECRLPGAVETEGNFDLRFTRFTRDRCIADCCHIYRCVGFENMCRIAF